MTTEDKMAADRAAAARWFESMRDGEPAPSYGAEGRLPLLDAFLASPEGRARAEVLVKRAGLPAEADESNPFNRTNLSEVGSEFPPLVCRGTAYEGWASLVSGPTGSAKSLVCRWLLFDAMREDGLLVGHADQEMGAVATRAYYAAMGATGAELDEIAYWDMPSPTMKSAEDWVTEVRESVALVLMDKVPDFMRSAVLAENSNDDVNTWMAALVEPLRGAVTVLLIDATGHAGEHARGGSEKGFKVGLAWMVEVLDEPRRDHVGLVRWTCTKDRFGAVGRGTTVEFAVGGDGAGRIVGSVVATVVGDSAAGEAEAAELRRRDRDDAWRVAALAAAKTHAPDEVRAVAKSTLETLMGGGRAADKRQGIGDAIGDMDPAHDTLGHKPKPGGNGVLVWWKPASLKRDSE